MFRFIKNCFFYLIFYVDRIYLLINNSYNIQYLINNIMYILILLLVYNQNQCIFFIVMTLPCINLLGGSSKTNFFIPWSNFNLFLHFYVCSVLLTGNFVNFVIITYFQLWCLNKTPRWNGWIRTTGRVKILT